jgi:hypothetical protein
MFRYSNSSLMLLTAVIAIGFGLVRIGFRSRAPLELDRALVLCDAIRIQCPKRGPNGEDIILTWEITQSETIDEVRVLLDVPSAQEDATETVILGGPALGVTLLERERETASFYVVHSLLTTPAYPEYKQRHYVLPSEKAWNLLLEMSEQQQ